MLPRLLIAAAWPSTGISRRLSRSASIHGYVSIIGKPNVGKSTILNHILGKKISITSRKSQTTRNNILGIKNVDNAQLIFADTPGMHIKSPKIMNKVLNKSAEGLIEYSDIILFVTQRLKLDEQDISVPYSRI